MTNLPVPVDSPDAGSQRGLPVRLLRWLLGVLQRLASIWPSPEPDSASLPSEIARKVDHELSRFGDDPSEAKFLSVIVRSPRERPALRSRTMARELDLQVRKCLRSAGRPPSIAYRYEVGLGAPIEVCVEDEDAQRAPSPGRLVLPNGTFLSFGDRARHRAGCGPSRRNEPGVANDLVLCNPGHFVHRDAFDLCWNRARQGWDLEVQDEHRESVRVRRGGRGERLQDTRFPLGSGDVIILRGRKATERFEITVLVDAREP